MGKKFTDLTTRRDFEDARFTGDKNDDVAVRTLDQGANDLLASIDSSLGGGGSATTQEIFNPSIALANTEQSLALPASIKGYLVRVRGAAGTLKITHVSGESGTKYTTVERGAVLTDLNSYTSLTLYFQSPTAGAVVEVVTWT